ncbi:hypothetical protein GCM10027563_28150 [Parasphingorhabdus pacifica]
MGSRGSYLPAERQRNAASHEVIADGAGVWHRAGEAVEFRYDQGVAVSHRRRCLVVQAGACSLGAAQAWSR